MIKRYPVYFSDSELEYIIKVMTGYNKNIVGKCERELNSRQRNDFTKEELTNVPEGYGGDVEH